MHRCLWYDRGFTIWGIFFMNPNYLLVAFVLAMPATAMPTSQMATCLTQAYEGVSQIKDGVVYFDTGASLPLGQVSSAPFTARLNHASIADQLSQVYPLNFVAPKQYEDAGRLRNDAFFKQLYGTTKQQVANNLVTVTWKPSGARLRFNQKQGAAAQLQKVGDELANYPELKRYVSTSLGAFNWRPIAGTKRLSSHSFGVAVDFQLPKGLHRYWRWDGCKTEDAPCAYPSQLMQDDNLKRVVAIFEKHGFIWGGKWSSYDTPHFEYRPELLVAACR